MSFSIKWIKKVAVQKCNLYGSNSTNPLSLEADSCLCFQSIFLVLTKLCFKHHLRAIKAHKCILKYHCFVAFYKTTQRKNRLLFSPYHPWKNGLLIKIWIKDKWTHWKVNWKRVGFSSIETANCSSICQWLKMGASFRRKESCRIALLSAAGGPI